MSFFLSLVVNFSLTCFYVSRLCCVYYIYLYIFVFSSFSHVSRYSTPVDVWSIGCIFAEMSTGRPLFPGTVESNQLERIFRKLGTPTPEIYPKIVELPDYRNDWTIHPRPESLHHLVPKLSEAGVDLLDSMLQYVYVVCCGVVVGHVCTCARGMGGVEVALALALEWHWYWCWCWRRHRA